MLLHHLQYCLLQLLLSRFSGWNLNGYTFDCIFDRLYAFLFPCMYIPEVIIGSLLALVLSTLGHSGTILLWCRPLPSFLLGLDLQVGFLVEWFCILPSEELLNSFPPSFLPEPVERVGATAVARASGTHFSSGAGLRNYCAFCQRGKGALRALNVLDPSNS